MYLERLVQITMATLAALGALLLGMGERNVGPPLFVAFAAGISVWLTDVTGWFRLGKNTANVSMLTAAAIAAYQSFHVESEMQALESAWFLIFLQLIILFQKKDERKYWMLILISLLQVVVATLFNQGIWFGVLLAAYMTLGFFGMTLLLLQREWRIHRTESWRWGQWTLDTHGHRGRFRDGLSNIAEFFSENIIPPAPEDARTWSRDIKAVFSGWFSSSAAAKATMSAVATAPTRSMRWPLMGQTAEFTCRSSGEGSAALGRDLYGRMGRMVLHALILAMVLFFAVPRLGQTTWRGAVSATTVPMVGFSEHVSLGQLGSIIESPDKVMQVRFYDPATHNSQPIQSEIYLQGAILMSYKDGRWQCGLPSWQTRTELLEEAETLPAKGIVYQDISLESLDHEELFFVPPFIPLKSTYEISYNLAQLRLLRSPEGANRRFGYRLGTTAIVDGQQLPLVPRRWSEDTRQRAMQMPTGDRPESGKGLPNLRDLAQRWLDESGLPKEDRAGRARYLASRFVTSGKFQYSLAQQDRDNTIDPIEDFVTKHSQGHCEYFATALTLMLRSQGIPARMVVGYKCDEWNPMGKYFQVRQLHAHTWVEAFLKPYQIPPELLHGKAYWPWIKYGGWLRLDPTPGGVGSARPSDWMTPVIGAMDWLDATWTTYVRELDANTQRDAIYGPIVRGATAAWDFLTNPESWQTFFSELAARWHLNELSTAARWLLGIGVGIVVLGILAIIGWLLWCAGRRIASRWLPRRVKRDHHSSVEFYHRFETILGERGFWRTCGQTQLEFAEAAGNHLALTSGNPEWPILVRVVADAFYRVRFGGEPLDNSQAEKVEQVIQNLSESMK
jgi:transglutaminase-like putative cysteine protease